jgi:hypothetical protein
VTRLVIADIDQDGKGDPVLSIGRSIYFMGCLGHWEVLYTLADGDGSPGSAIVFDARDLDNDGDVDLVVLGQKGKVMVLENVGHGKLKPPAAALAGAATNATAGEWLCVVLV